MLQCDTGYSLKGAAERGTATDGPSLGPPCWLDRQNDNEACWSSFTCTKGPTTMEQARIAGSFDASSFARYPASRNNSMPGHAAEIAATPGSNAHACLHSRERSTRMSTQSMSQRSQHINPLEEPLLGSSNSRPSLSAPDRRQDTAAAAAWAAAEGGVVPYNPLVPATAISSRASAQKRSAQAAALGRACPGQPSRLLRSASAAELYTQPEGRVRAGRARGGARISAQVPCLARSFDNAFLTPPPDPVQSPGVVGPAGAHINILSWDSADNSRAHGSLTNTVEGAAVWVTGGPEVVEGKVRGGLSQGTRSSAAWGTAHDLLKRQSSTPALHAVSCTGGPSALAPQAHSWSMDGVGGVGGAAYHGSSLSLASLHSLDTLLLPGTSPAEGEGKVHAGAGALEHRVWAGQSLRSPRTGTSSAGGGEAAPTHPGGHQSVDSGVLFNLSSAAVCQPFAAASGGDAPLITLPLPVAQGDPVGCMATSPPFLSTGSGAVSGTAPHAQQVASSSVDWAPEGLVVSTLPRTRRGRASGHQAGAASLSSLPGAALAHLDRTLLINLTAANTPVAPSSDLPTPVASGVRSGSEGSLVSCSAGPGGCTSASASLGSMGGSSPLYGNTWLSASHPTSPGLGSGGGKGGPPLGSLSSPGPGGAQRRLPGGGLFKVFPLGVGSGPAATAHRRGNPAGLPPPPTISTPPRSLSSGGMLCFGSWDQPHVLANRPGCTSTSAVPSTSLLLRWPSDVDQAVGRSSSSVLFHSNSGEASTKAAPATLPAAHLHALMRDAIGSLTAPAGLAASPPPSTASPPLPVAAAAGGQNSARALSPFAATTAQQPADHLHSQDSQARTPISCTLAHRMSIDSEPPPHHQQHTPLTPARTEPGPAPRHQAMQHNLSSGRSESAGITYGAAAAAMAGAVTGGQQAPASPDTRLHQAASAHSLPLSLLEYAEEVALRTSLTHSAATLLTGSLPSPHHLSARSHSQTPPPVSPAVSGRPACGGSFIVDTPPHMSGSFCSLPFPTALPQQPASSVSLSSWPGGSSMAPVLVSPRACTLPLLEQMLEEEEEGEEGEEGAGGDPGQVKDRDQGGGGAAHSHTTGSEAASAPSFSCPGMESQHQQGCITAAAAGAGCDHTVVSLSMPSSSTAMSTSSQCQARQFNSSDGGAARPLCTPRLPLGVLADELNPALGHTAPQLLHQPQFQASGSRAGSSGTHVSSLRMWAGLNEGACSGGPGVGSQVSGAATSSTTKLSATELPLLYGPSLSSGHSQSPGHEALMGAAANGEEDTTQPVLLSMCDDVDAAELAAARQRVLQSHALVHK